MNAGGSLPSGLVAYDQYGHPHRRLVPAASWPEPLNTVFDARSIDGTELQPNSAATTATSATLLPSGETSPRSSGSAPDSERPQDENGPSSGDKANSKKRKKAKEKVPLAIDQPLTSQGKERVRVYLACAQCRQRKIRCDGAKPTCEVCIKRGVPECNYDNAPKRRGPDRVPGSRSRIREEEEAAAAGPSRRRRRRPSPPMPSDTLPDLKQMDAYSAALGPIPLPRQSGQTYPVSILAPASVTYDRDLEEQRSYRHRPPTTNDHQVISRPQNGALSTRDDTDRVPLDYPVRSAYISEVDGTTDSVPWEYALAREPSLDFVRATWWDSLLSVYCAPAGVVDEFPSHARELATRAINQDVRWLFKMSNYWLNFFHPQFFLDRIFDPARRRMMQPSLVLSALALSTLLQSSELGRGVDGRATALRLAEEAHAALQASINARWIDDDLAQAALLLAIFETCPHPKCSSQRSRDAMVMLDSIIRVLSLTSLDAADPAVTTYATPAPLPPGPGGPVVQAELQRAHYGAHEAHVSNPGSVTRAHRLEGCSCQSFSLGVRSPLAREQTPLWLSAPAWSDDWSEGEVRKESCRRLCWSALSLAAGHTSYASAITGNGLDLAITNPANFALLFNGETSCRALGRRPPAESKETVWALYDRISLLWHSCLRTRVDTKLSYPDKAQFAMAAWLELDAIQEALEAHTCGLERAFLYQGREVIFNTRMVISYEYQKFMPSVMTNFNGFFHRAKAEEWLRRQMAMATGSMHGLSAVTGLHSSLLMYRPFFAPWFMAQISRCLMLWRVDTTLTLALAVAVKWLAPVDYLLTLWPSHVTRDRFGALRQQLHEACMIAGLEPPPPPQHLLLPTTQVVI